MYKVRLYMDFTVEADSEDEAMAEAESMLVEELEQSHVGLTELFNYEVKKEEGGE